MSDNNVLQGEACYTSGDEATRTWFLKQWSLWPERADSERTTNASFHYGGVLAHRETFGTEPDMSHDFRAHVAWLDRHTSTTA